MKVYIKTDLEGVSGVYGKTFISKDMNRPELIAEAKRMLAHDLNACIDACFKAGASQVIAADCHGGGHNLMRSQVDDRAWFISGDTRRSFREFENTDALILLGYHAMAGTEHAVLEHTMSSAGIQNVWLNDRKVGEVGILASIAAEHGVPTVLVSGDDKVCLEAADWIPGVVTCEVKKSYSCNGCLMPPLSVSRQRIIDKTLEALSQVPSECKPSLSYPVRYRVELVERGRIPENPVFRHIDGRTYEISSDSVESAMRFLY